MLRLALVSLIAATACGCGNGDDASDELVRYEVDSRRLPFNEGPNGSTPARPPDAVLVISSGGDATYRLANLPEVDFRLSDDEFSEVERALDRVDFNEASQELTGGGTSGGTLISVAHDGMTVALGDVFYEIAYGEGPAVHDHMSDLLEELDRLLGQTPEVEAARDRYLDEFLGVSEGDSEIDGNELPPCANRGEPVAPMPCDPTQRPREGGPEN